MKRFNVTGLCIPEEHYMCDVTAKFERCKYLVEEGFYYAINFPRQYGKTTMKYLVTSHFDKDDDYIAISSSFEGIGDLPFQSEEKLAPMVLDVFASSLKFTHPEISSYLSRSSKKITNFKKLSEFIEKWVFETNKKIIIFIDEIDKASNNQVFISFIAMLRDKYLLAKEKKTRTFYSVVLLGVHDVKSLKLKLRLNEEAKLNSPWNISEDLNIEFSFSKKEIEPMLADYGEEHCLTMPVSQLSEKLFYYTSGNPFLVSQMCKVIDETIMAGQKHSWTTYDVEAAYKYLINLGYTTTNFDDMYKNLENNEDLRNVIYRIVINGDIFPFDIGDPVIAKGKTYGLLSQNSTGKCDISNKIYEFRILNYFISKHKTMEIRAGSYSSEKFKENNELNILLILEKFQLFMKEYHSSKDNSFLEKNGRLLLMSFFRPIINGKGYMFKENVTAEDRKMDLVVTYNDKRYVIELKIWYGEKYLSDGIEQLCTYLDSYSLDRGYMLIFNFNKNKKYETIKVEDCRKDISAVFV